MNCKHTDFREAVEAMEVQDCLRWEFRKPVEARVMSQTVCRMGADMSRVYRLHFYCGHAFILRIA